jgi:hypothetical protein
MIKFCLRHMLRPFLQSFCNFILCMRYLIIYKIIHEVGINIYLSLTISQTKKIHYNINWKTLKIFTIYLSLKANFDKKNFKIDEKTVHFWIYPQMS